MSKRSSERRLAEWQAKRDAERSKYMSAKYGPETYGLPSSCTRYLEFNTQEVKRSPNKVDQGSRIVAIVHK